MVRGHYCSQTGAVAVINVRKVIHIDTNTRVSYIPCHRCITPLTPETSAGSRILEARGLMRSENKSAYVNINCTAYQHIHSLHGCDTKSPLHF